MLNASAKLRIETGAICEAHKFKVKVTHSIYNRNYWRQGYAHESCKAVIDYAFTELKAHKIFAEAIDTVKSVGLMKKLGMQHEGIQRSQTKDNHGNWADLYFYGLLEDDWRKHGNQI